MNTKEQDQKSKEKKPFNSKVRANYFKALNSPWLDAWVAKENKMLFLKEGRKHKFSENFVEEISPIQSQKQPKINSTMETDAFDKSKINQVFALLANPENEPPDFGEENQMKSELKEAYETFQINATNLNSQQQIKLAELLTEFKDLWNEQKREDPLT